MEKAILSLERGAMNRWREGHLLSWAEISAEELTYVDPCLGKPLVGLEAYRSYLQQIERTARFDGSEFIAPRVAAVGADVALLTYNFRSTAVASDSAGAAQLLWNATKVYFRFFGDWKIVHAHLSFVKHRLPEMVEVPVPVRSAPGLDDGILSQIMTLERAAMERWRKGDPRGFIEISTPEVTYFDTGTPRRLDGRESLSAEYAQREGKIHYDVMEFINPMVQVRGDAAVLFYRFFSTQLNGDGSVASRTPWNCSEVYSRLEGTWRIIHTHWSLIKGERM